MMRATALACLVSAAALAEPSVSVTPDRIVLGHDRAVEIVAKGDQVLGSASEGTLSKPVREGDGWHFHWTPPDSGPPRTAILLFWETSANEPDVAVERVAMIGHTDLAVETEPRADVTVTVEGKTFGPRHADASGHVKVPVEVPPGVKEAKVSAEAEGRTKDREVPLQLPPDNEIAIAAGPQPMDGKTGWVLVAGSHKLAADRLKVTASGATIEPSGSHDGEPTYRVKPRVDASSVPVTAAVIGTSAHAKETIAVKAQPKGTEEPEISSGPATVQVPAPSKPLVFGVEAGLGYFTAGGSNHGPIVRLGGEVGPFVDERLFVQLLLEFRHSSLDQVFPGLTTQHSSVTGFPIVAAARGVLLEHGLLGLDARLGIGLMPFSHSVDQNLGASFSESKISWMGFVAIDGRYTVGQFEPYVELQGAIAPAKTDRLDASLGGLGVLVGARFHP